MWKSIRNLTCLSFLLHITNFKFGFHIAHWRFRRINFEDSKQWYCFVLLFGKQAVKVNYFSWSVQWEFWESTALKNWKLSYQSYFYSLTAKLIVFLMFDLFQYGKAAIHYAAERGHLEIIALLIKNGADANIKEARVRKISQMFCHDSNSF